MPAICKPIAWTNEKLRPCLDRLDQRLDSNSAFRKCMLNIIIEVSTLRNTTFKKSFLTSYPIQNIRIQNNLKFENEQK